MVDITHYEVYVDRGNGWKLEERFPEEQHDSAIKFAHELEHDNVSVKLIREKFNVMDNNYQETVEFVNIVEKKGKKKARGESSNFFSKDNSDKNDDNEVNSIYSAVEEQTNSLKNIAMAVVKLILIIIFSLLFANLVVTLSLPLVDETMPEESAKTILFLFFFGLFLLVAVPLILKKVPWQVFGLRRRRKKIIPEKKFLSKVDAIVRLYNLNSGMAADVVPSFPEADMKYKRKIVEFLSQMIAHMDSRISISDDFNRLGLRFLVYGACMELARYNKLNIAQANSLLHEAFSIIDGKEVNVAAFYEAKNTYQDIKVAVFLTGVGAYLMSQKIHGEDFDWDLWRITFGKWSKLNNITYQQKKKEETQKQQKPVVKEEKTYANGLVNVYLRTLYNGNDKNPQEYSASIHEGILNIINNLAGKYNGSVISDEKTLISVQFSNMVQGAKCAEEILGDAKNYVEELADENLIVAERVVLIEAKADEFESKEDFIEDLISQTYDGEIIMDENISKVLSAQGFDIEDLGVKKLEKTGQSVSLHKLKL